MSEQDLHPVEREQFHDAYWTPLRLWGLGAVTLGSALLLIWWLSGTFTRPI